MKKCHEEHSPSLVRRHKRANQSWKLRHLARYYDNHVNISCDISTFFLQRFSVLNEYFRLGIIQLRDSVQIGAHSEFVSFASLTISDAILPTI
jgi:hypothetical protein